MPSPQTPQWYIFDGERWTGPFKFEEIQKMLHSGQIQHTSAICTEPGAVTSDQAELTVIDLLKSKSNSALGLLDAIQFAKSRQKNDLPIHLPQAPSQPPLELARLFGFIFLFGTLIIFTLYILNKYSNPNTAPAPSPPKVETTPSPTTDSSAIPSANLQKDLTAPEGSGISQTPPKEDSPKNSPSKENRTEPKPSLDSINSIEISEDQPQNTINPTIEEPQAVSSPYPEDFKSDPETHLE